MRKLYEIFKVLKVRKRIVSTETIRGNTVDFLWILLIFYPSPENLITHFAIKVSQIREILFNTVYIHADSSLSTLSIGKIGRASKLLLEVKFCKSAICDDQLFCVSAQLSGEAMAKAR